MFSASLSCNRSKSSLLFCIPTSTGIWASCIFKCLPFCGWILQEKNWQILVYIRQEHLIILWKCTCTLIQDTSSDLVAKCQDSALQSKIQTLINLKWQKEASYFLEVGFESSHSSHLFSGAFSSHILGEAALNPPRFEKCPLNLP